MWENKLKKRIVAECILELVSFYTVTENETLSIEIDSHSTG